MPSAEPTPSRGPESGLWGAAAERGNPFVGLRPFEPEEEHLFFGREKHSEEFLRRLRRGRFLAVVGTSGSGKSSLVRAGLLPMLYGGMMSGAGSRWRVALFRPGSDPIGELARALERPGVLGVETGDEAEARLRATMTASTLRRSALGLTEVVKHARMPEGENLLVVVDQFEEIFRFKQTAAGRRGAEDSAAFIKLLLEASQAKDLPIYVLLTMRSDFLGDCAQFRDLPEAINDGQFLIPRLSRGERRQTIVGPVKVAGAKVSPRLVQRLLNDVGDDPDQLPVLQHALMRTWDVWRAASRDGEVLDVDAYEQVGRLEGALSQHADEVYDELDADGRRIAETLFKALTDTSSDPRGVRRPARLSEVAAIAGVGEDEVIEVVERFRQPGRSFLMPPTGTALAGETVLDISHESLMRVWGRLKGWAEEERRSAEEYLLLARDAARHEAGEVDLLRDPALGLTLKWRDDNAPGEAWAERYDPAFARALAYLEESRRARDAATATEEQRRRRELRRVRAFAAILGLAFLGAAALGVFAFKQAELAEQQAALANSGRLALEAQRHLDQRLDLGLLLAAEAWLAAETPEAQAALLAALGHRSHLAGVLRHPGSARDLAWADGGRALLLASSEGEIYRFELDQGQQGQVVAGDGFAFKAALSPDGSLAKVKVQRGWEFWDLATGRRLADGTLWDPRKFRSIGNWPGGSVRTWSVGGEHGVQVSTFLDRRRRDHPPIVVGGRVRTLALSPDGRQLAVGLETSIVELWDVESGKQIEQGERQVDDRVWSLAWSPDSNWLAVGDFSGTVTLWDEKGSKRTLHGHQRAVSSLAFAPDGRTLASAGDGGWTLLWDLPRSHPLGEPLDGYEGYPASVAFDPRGGRLMACGRSGGSDGLHVWDLPSGDREFLPSEDHGATALAFQPEGRLLAVGGKGGGVTLWDVPSSQPSTEPLMAVTDWPDKVGDLAWSPDGALVAAGRDDGSTVLWEAASATLRHPPLGPSAYRGQDVHGLAFTAGGERLVVRRFGGRIEVWDVDTGEILPVEVEAGGQEGDIVVDADGRVFASAGEAIGVWDAGTGEPRGLPLAGHLASVTTLALAADGRTLASGDGAGTVLLWDVEERRLLGRLAGHPDQVLSLAFDPAGERLASGGREGRVILWDLRPSAWRQAACRLAGRNLTREEWRQHLGALPYRRTCPDLPEPGEDEPASSTPAI